MSNESVWFSSEENECNWNVQFAHLQVAHLSTNENSIASQRKLHSECIPSEMYVRTYENLISNANCLTKFVICMLIFCALYVLFLWTSWGVKFNVKEQSFLLYLKWYFKKRRQAERESMNIDLIYTIQGGSKYNIDRGV